ncbi:MAG: flavin reductase [Flavobacteriales bacterium]|nr:flavin reductase [Flavobacteriales bacterium]
MDRIARLKLVNAISGVRPATLIGTKNDQGRTNLAIFNSIAHIGSDPPLLGLIFRPVDEVRRHTWENIMQSGWYTINHVHPEYIENAHQTSAKYPTEISEFKACGFCEEYVAGIQVPFVKESQVRMALELAEIVKIELNGTFLLVGEIKYLHIHDDVSLSDGQPDFTGIAAGVSGLNSYYNLQFVKELPYARIGNSQK